MDIMESRDKKNIILTGFMATGKTTVGKTLASQLGYDFVDTDELLESRIGMTIAEFFQKEGEEAFRKMEADLAKELADKRGLIIATGGRFMLDPDNADALVKTGRVFCLVATPEEILERAEGDSHVRPLLQAHNPLEHIVALLQQDEWTFAFGVSGLPATLRLLLAFARGFSPLCSWRSCRTTWS